MFLYPTEASKVLWNCKEWAFIVRELGIYHLFWGFGKHILGIGEKVIRNLGKFRPYLFSGSEGAHISPPPPPPTALQVQL